MYSTISTTQIAELFLESHLELYRSGNLVSISFNESLYFSQVREEAQIFALDERSEGSPILLISPAIPIDPAVSIE